MELTGESLKKEKKAVLKENWSLNGWSFIKASIVYKYEMQRENLVLSVVHRRNFHTIHVHRRFHPQGRVPSNFKVSELELNL